jgi:hypothetical protein
MTPDREAASAAELRRTLMSVPDAVADPDPAIDAAIASSVGYLGSDAALDSIAVDPYWPKWNAPWWHAVMLHELGEARQIPARTIARLIDRVNALPVKFFPIYPEDAPGIDPQRDVLCHCALGCLYQVLAACGVDVDAALPWIKPWFVRYQMADGGLNCDDTAYRVTGECPTSMVATVAPFEAMLLGAWSDAQRGFLARAAQFLIARGLVHGSPTLHNADERAAAASWGAPCFPRFYFYDVLRGLAALVQWAERSGQALPLPAITGAIDPLIAAFPDGVVRVARDGIATHPRTTALVAGTWVRQPTSRFALLDATDLVGTPSAALTRQWTATRHQLIALIDAGRITG